MKNKQIRRIVTGGLVALTILANEEYNIQQPLNLDDDMDNFQEFTLPQTESNPDSLTSDYLVPEPFSVEEKDKTRVRSQDIH